LELEDSDSETEPKPQNMACRTKVCNALDASYARELT
jgi:hypothetical protein